MTITIGRLTELDIPSMYITVNNNFGYLEELNALQYFSYDQFFNHYKYILDESSISIFLIKINGIVAGAVEVDEKEDSYYIGYWMGHDYRNRGITTIAVLDVITNELPLDKPLTADIELDNTASKRVLEKLGFIETIRTDKKIYYQLIDRPRST